MKLNFSDLKKGTPFKPKTNKQSKVARSPAKASTSYGSKHTKICESL